MKDTNLITTSVFPAAGAANNHASIDFGPMNDPGAISPNNVEVEISWPLLAALVDAKNVVFQVQDSADNSSFADLGLEKTITGSGGAGVVAGTKKFCLPQNARRYIRLNQTQDAAGGNITASSSTFSVITH